MIAIVEILWLLDFVGKKPEFWEAIMEKHTDFIFYWIYIKLFWQKLDSLYKLAYIWPKVWTDSASEICS